MNRRPIPARSARWALAIAGWLAARRVRPNQISLCSVLFAALAGVCLVLAGRGEPGWRTSLFLAAAALIELRLLCNLLDGMVAIEGGLGTKSGVILNELPDRLADAVTLALAGYSLTWADWASALGWAAALFAVLTAYVRVLGGSVGLPQDFSGPMAKPHRMQLLAAACPLAMAESFTGSSGRVMAAALTLIILGSAATILRRGIRIIRAIEAA